MKTTGNLGLKKPDGTDIVDITDLNGNMDILDTAVKAVQDHAADTVKHITAAERSAWNAKASTAVATVNTAGLMAGADKSKLDSVAQGANNYTHPSTHSPSIIAQDSSNRFVTDAEKAAWNGKANLVTTPQQTTADITYYVRTDGNDGNTGLANTAGGAFRTIGKAISLVPQVINHTVAINVAAGTYAEDVIISGTNGAGYVAFIGTSASIRSFTAARCNRIVVSGFTATSTTQSAFYAYDGGKCDFTSCIVNVSNNNTGITFFNQLGSVEGCTISNRSVAIQVEKGLVTITNCAGTGNITAILPSGGALVNTSGTIMSGALDGANGGVLNPWGDNNTLSRTGVAGGSLAAQNMNPLAMTKINYNDKYYDYLNEWVPGTGTFTPKQSGLYTFDVVCSLQGAPSGVSAGLHMFKSGIEDQCLGRSQAAGAGDLVISGHVTTDLSAGQSVQIYIYHTHSSGLSTSGNNRYNFFRVSRTS